ncbi:MAG TPA: VWA domain-containing protein [Chitinophagaceae bacterium]|nr:VWA domain-containing protein [Chitinophagaceae bacterium]
MNDYLSFEQIPFGSDSFADNPEPRCPCVLLLDTSGSMSGLPIRELNSGIQAFKQELMQDQLAMKRVEIAVITFGPVQVEADFHTVSNFYPKDLIADHDTPMGEAIIRGIELVTKRKQEYKNAGIAYYKPWIILITDGSPTDAWRDAAKLVKEGEDRKSFAFFAIGVEGASMEILKQISVREPLRLKGLMFREFFVWLSASMKMVSGKNPGVNNQLLPPSGWTDL